MTEAELDRFLDAIEHGLDDERKIQIPFDLDGTRYYAQHTSEWQIPKEIVSAISAAGHLEYFRGFAESRNADLLETGDGAVILRFKSAA